MLIIRTHPFSRYALTSSVGSVTRFQHVCSKISMRANLSLPISRMNGRMSTARSDTQNHAGFRLSSLFIKNPRPLAHHGIGKRQEGIAFTLTSPHFVTSPMTIYNGPQNLDHPISEVGEGRGEPTAMTIRRRPHRGEVTAKVVLEARRGERTIHARAAAYAGASAADQPGEAGGLSRAANTVVQPTADAGEGGRSPAGGPLPADGPGEGGARVAEKTR